jgi:hypothetical protein
MNYNIFSMSNLWIMIYNLQLHLQLEVFTFMFCSGPEFLEDKQNKNGMHPFLQIGMSCSITFNVLSHLHLCS